MPTIATSLRDDGEHAVAVPPGMPRSVTTLGLQRPDRCRRTAEPKEKTLPSSATSQ
jgi:hypothetical protein